MLRLAVKVDLPQIWKTAQAVWVGGLGEGKGRNHVHHVFLLNTRIRRKGGQGAGRRGGMGDLGFPLIN